MSQGNISAVDVFRAEMQLGEAARQVFNVTRRETIAKRLVNLMEVAAAHAQTVAEIEETDNPLEITKNALVLVTEDIRTLWGEDKTTEDDPYSRYLEANRSRLPLIESVLDDVLRNQN
jgi:hypothetical protein